MGVEFQEEQYNYSRQNNSTEKGIIGLVIKLGIAKNAMQANLILIGLIVVLIFISWFSLSSLGGPKVDNTVDSTVADPALNP